MKFWVLISLVGLTQAFTFTEISKQAKLTERVNSVQDLWVANEDHESVLNTKKIFLLHGVCGHNSNSTIENDKDEEFTAEESEEFKKLPKSFDGRVKWGKKCPSVLHISDQSACGACYAFGSTEAMQDRICIKSNGKKQVRLSAIDLVSCDKNEMGCRGSKDVGLAYNFYNKTGIVTGTDFEEKKGCRPYPFKACTHFGKAKHYPQCPYDQYPTPQCIQQCQKGYTVPFNKDKHFGKKHYKLTNAKKIQLDLFKNGPVTAVFEVCEDFISYKSGIYIPVSTTSFSRHAVKFVGWGQENGVPFWIIANSWNKYWGENGYFRIRRGKDDCKIESGALASLPRL